MNFWRNFRLITEIAKRSKCSAHFSGNVIFFALRNKISMLRLTTQMLLLEVKNITVRKALSSILFIGAVYRNCDPSLFAKLSKLSIKQSGF